MLSPLDSSFSGQENESLCEEDSESHESNTSTSSTFSKLLNNNTAAKNLDSIFRCFICFGKVKTPVMCPQCSKIGCTNCFKRWLMDSGKNFCPHCRTSLSFQQLVKCRHLSDLETLLSEELKKLVHKQTPDSECGISGEEGNEQSTASKKNPSGGNNHEVCPSHGLPLNYFCATCGTPVCSDCAIVDSKHKTHQFSSIKEVYSEHLQKIEKELSKLHDKLNYSKSLITDIDKKIEKVNKQKEERESEMRKFIRETQERLLTTMKDKLSVLLSYKQTYEEEKIVVEQTLDRITNEIETSPKSSLIMRADSIVALIREIDSSQTQKLASSSSVGQQNEEIQKEREKEKEKLDEEIAHSFASELIPKYEGSSFKIDNFSSIRKTEEILYSQAFQIRDTFWRLKVYPAGTGFARNNFISVFLEMYKGLKKPGRFEYRIELLNQQKKKPSIVREFSSVFDEEAKGPSSWGYNRFYKLVNLSQEGFIGEDDSLIFNFYVRNPTYFSLAQEQQEYITTLEEEIKILKLKNKNLQVVLGHGHNKNEQNNENKNEEISNPNSKGKEPEIKAKAKENEILTENEGNNQQKSSESQSVPSTPQHSQTNVLSATPKINENRNNNVELEVENLVISSSEKQQNSQPTTNEPKISAKTAAIFTQKPQTNQILQKKDKIHSISTTNLNTSQHHHLKKTQNLSTGNAITTKIPTTSQQNMITMSSKLQNVIQKSQNSKNSNLKVEDLSFSATSSNQHQRKANLSLNSSSGSGFGFDNEEAEIIGDEDDDDDEDGIMGEEDNAIFEEEFLTRLSNPNLATNKQKANSKSDKQFVDIFSVSDIGRLNNFDLNEEDDDEDDEIFQ